MRCPLEKKLCSEKLAARMNAVRASGHPLYHKRARLGVTLGQVALASGLPENDLLAFEKGERCPTSSELAKWRRGCRRPQKLSIEIRQCCHGYVRHNMHCAERALYRIGPKQDEWRTGRRRYDHNFCEKCKEAFLSDHPSYRKANTRPLVWNHPRPRAKTSAADQNAMERAARFERIEEPDLGAGY